MDTKTSNSSEAVRKIICYWDEQAGRWKAEFHDPLLVGGKDFGIFDLAWKKEEDDKKVLKTMKRDWKHHLVSIRGPKPKRHEALGG